MMPCLGEVERPVPSERGHCIIHDPDLRGLWLSMPEVITLRVIQDLRRRLARHLAALPSDNETNILIDTNQHAFESLACIKAFRDALEQSGIAERGCRVAFVTPAKYRAPQIVSEREAYFSDVAAARAWLQSSRGSQPGQYA